MNRKNQIISLLFPSSGAQKLHFGYAEKVIAFKLCPENFGRALVLAEFIRNMKRIFPEKLSLRIAVVGGHPDEPEIRALNYLGFSLQVEIFGIENSSNFLDLNLRSRDEPSSQQDFDLILCSQVWEHIWNHEAAFINLISMMNCETFLWIACPASNRAHGSPDYFSAGFTSGYFSNNLSKFPLSILGKGQLGTRRNYLATHNLPTWLSLYGHIFPPFFAFSQYRFPLSLIYSIRYLGKTTALMFASKKVTSHSKFVTETWVLAKFKNSR